MLQCRGLSSKRHSLLLLATVLSAAASAAPVTWTEREDWAPHFVNANASGTIVVVDTRNGAHYVYNRKRADQRFVPASTFKLPHALFALDSGIVRDEFQLFRWDRVERSNAEWNKDQTLRSSMRNSVVWVYQEIARELGEAREREYLKRIAYGSADPSGGIDRFWLDGGLRISAFEQIAFLERLYRNALPFRLADQRLVKDVMIVEAQRNWILRAKSGWGTPRMEAQVGWWVGWVERAEGAIFFAMNMEMPNGLDDAPKREEITREILKTLDALPR